MKYANSRRYLRQGTFTQMMVLEAVGRLGSMTRAAEELCIAQPTASVRIAKLAEAVGLPLTELHGRGMRLTRAGEEIAAAYRQIVATLANMDERLGATQSGEDPPDSAAAGALTVIESFHCAHAQRARGNGRWSRRRIL